MPANERLIVVDGGAAQLNAAQKILGLSAEDMLGKQFDSVLAAFDARDNSQVRADRIYPGTKISQDNVIFGPAELKIKTNRKDWETWVVNAGILVKSSNIFGKGGYTESGKGGYTYKRKKENKRNTTKVVVNTKMKYKENTIDYETGETREQPIKENIPTRSANIFFIYTSIYFKFNNFFYNLLSFRRIFFLWQDNRLKKS